MRVRDKVGGVMEQWNGLAQRFGIEKLGVRRQRPDSDLLADFDAFLLRDAADVDQKRWRGKPQLEGWDQGMAAGDKLCAVGICRQQRDRVRNRFGPDVVEGGGDHWFAPVRAAWIADQIRGGVMGMSRCDMPNGDNASSTACTMHAGAAIE